MEDEEEIDAEASDLDSDKTEETDEETADSASDKGEETDKEIADSNTEERVASKSTVLPCDIFQCTPI